MITIKNKKIWSFSNIYKNAKKITCIIIPIRIKKKFYIFINEMVYRFLVGCYHNNTKKHMEEYTDGFDNDLVLLFDSNNGNEFGCIKESKIQNGINIEGGTNGRNAKNILFVIQNLWIVNYFFIMIIYQIYRRYIYIYLHKNKKLCYINYTSFF